MINFTYNEQKSDLKIKFVKISNENDLKFSKFEGKKFQIELVKDKLYIGINEISNSDEWRDLGFKLTIFLKNLKIENISIKLPKNSYEFIEGMMLGDYSFTKYKSEPKEETLKEISFCGDEIIQKYLTKAFILVKSQFLVKDIVNTSPEDANSETISQLVLDELIDSNINVKIYHEKELKELNMNGHLAVNRASRHEAKTIKLTYEPIEYDINKPIKHICLIGKGLTYDSGGLSLKPATSMTTMKMDKSGAITVFGIMKAISELNINNNVKVTAYMCLAENMIDSSAYKPDDVLIMKNGKTVHVKNTDAEGRIVLFDNICLAQEENKDLTEIYTFATLTGAAIVQFGKEAAAMVGFNDDLKSNIKKYGQITDEIFLNAEFHKYMLDGVDDTLADLSNTGTPNMGCQKAGLFLSKALTEDNKNKFVHLDIAGPAYAEKTWGTNKGFAVRTFLEYLSNI
jgi:leucyl aminopeptidase